jgi:adenylate cyclase
MRFGSTALATERVERRLAAILAADVVGYSRLMGADEEGTLARLKAHRRELIDPKIKEHKGRIVKTTGDGKLAEFSSVVDAVRSAAEIQRAMVDSNAGTAEDKRITFRIGVNLGDVIADGDDIYGDGVNIAARLEALAEPGGICVSRVVRDQVRDKLDFAFEDMGEQKLKNIARPLRVYRLCADRVAVGLIDAVQPSLPLPDKPSIAVLPFQNLSGDPEQEYFADGMVEEIITALSRIRWLFVIARNSSFTYKAQSLDVKQVGSELGVRYVLEGSVRKAGRRLRIADRRDDRCSSLGRPVRRLARRHLRPSGSGGAQHCRCYRADLASRGNSSLGRAADQRFDRLRSVPACSLGCVDIRAGPHRRGARAAWAGDCPRTAIRPRSCLGGYLPCRPRKLRLGR